MLVADISLINDIFSPSWMRFLLFLITALVTGIILISKFTFVTDIAHITNIALINKTIHINIITAITEITHISKNTLIIIIGITQITDIIPLSLIVFPEY